MHILNEEYRGYAPLSVRLVQMTRTYEIFSLLIVGGAVCLGEAMLFDDEDILLRKGMWG